MHPKSFLKRLWRRLLHGYRRKQLWYGRVRLHASRLLEPGTQMFDDDEDLLGTLPETPYWAPFLKYLDLRRNDMRDNALIIAKDAMEVGEVKGNINMCNTFEFDIMRMNEQKHERSRLTKLETLASEEVPDDTTDL